MLDGTLVPRRVSLGGRRCRDVGPQENIWGNDAVGTPDPKSASQGNKIYLGREHFGGALSCTCRTSLLIPSQHHLPEMDTRKNGLSL